MEGSDPKAGTGEDMHPDGAGCPRGTPHALELLQLSSHEAALVSPERGMSRGSGRKRERKLRRRTIPDEQRGPSLQLPLSACSAPSGLPVLSSGCRRGSW